MEEQSKKTVILVLAALGVVAIIFALFFYWRGSHGEKQAAAPTHAERAQRATPEVAAPESQGSTKAERYSLTTQPADSKEAQLKRFCLDFTARFGTYSTDSEAMNLQQLLPQMTGDLKTWATGHLAPQKPAQTFSGVVTTALATKIISQTGAAAVVKVGARRTYTEGTTKRETFEDATVTLANVSGQWLVSGVKWDVRPE